METINISNFRKDVYKTVDSAINFDPVRISTKSGSAIIISEEEYQGLQETLYLTSIKGMTESILEGSNTPVEACIKEENFKW